MNRRAHIIVSGRVQGVAFRAYAQQEAAQRGLQGWAANRPDGTVEIVAEGDASSVQHMIGWVHHGPSHANVDDVQVRYEEPTGEFNSFEIQ